MNVLAQNEKYIVWNEYETTYLTIKDEGKVVTIGDFYGDPSCAMIDRNNRYCVVAGCGVIIYYFNEPYLPYRYNYTTEQWTEFYRDGNFWIKSVHQIDYNHILITFETNIKESILIEKV